MNRLLPERLDNDYRGHPLALWVFVGITLITIGRSLVHVLVADGGAQSIATVPLDTMRPAAAGAVVHVFGLWGLSQLLLAVVYVVAVVRYRSMLPLLYLLFVVEYVGRFLLAQWKPVETVETPPGATANIVFPVVGLVMLVLSLRERSRGSADPAATG